MISLLQRLRRAFVPGPVHLDEAEWSRVVARVPWVAALDPARRERLRTLVGRFLRDKAIVPVGDFAIDAHQAQVLAALCCLPVLEFGYGGLAGWSELILYPDTFRAHRSHFDEHTGVLTEGEEELAGEAWDRGPVILSWGDIEADLAEPDAGFNVAAHEIAHKLDVLDGVMDGTPPLPRDWQRAWARDFQAAYDALCEDLDQGREPAIDAYAASAPEEFFAVCTEYHFSAPQALADAMPAVAAHLERFYGPSPFHRRAA